MKTPEEFKKYILENFKNDNGDIEICDVDLSDFDGNVYIKGWKVKQDLCQDYQIVEGDLYQGRQKVGGYLWQSGQEVGKDLSQTKQKFNGYLYNHKVKGNECVVKEGEDFILIDRLKEITKEELAEMGYKLKEE